MGCGVFISRTSRGLEDGVIGLVGGVVKGGEDILALEEWGGPRICRLQW